MFSFDPYSPAVDADPFPFYKTLRDEYPCFWSREANMWVLSRYADILAALNNWQTYSSASGNLMDELPNRAGATLGTTDPPRHDRLRGLIQFAFVKRNLEALAEQIRAIARAAAAPLAGEKRFDFIEDFSSKFTVRVLIAALGLPMGDEETVREKAVLMVQSDPVTRGKGPQHLAAYNWMTDYASKVIAERRANPQNDLISILTKAYDDGDLQKDHKAYQGVDEATIAAMREKNSLSDDELFAFLAVLMVAGNETTRNAISGGMLALSQFPDQKKLMLDNLDVDDFMDRAVDELIRYVSPVLGFIRTVTKDHTYRNTELKEGDRILMLYPSANRDERALDRPNELNFERDVNPHLAFGIGPHFCLGANLARMEVKLVFQELLGRLPDIQIPTDAVIPRGESSLVLALQHMPATFTAGGCPVAH
mgnify:CR=1 FL=1